MKKMLPSIFAFFCLCLCTNAQESGIIKGKLTDKSTGEDIVFANVVLEQNGQMITGAAADINGCYEIKNIKAGSYDLRFKFIGYRDGFVSGINVVDDSTVVINHAFIQEVKLSCVEVTVQSSPKMTLGVVPGVMRSGRYKSPKISKRTLKNASRVENLRGSREHSNYYYIDGVKVRGGESLPKAKIEQVQTVLGGLPAQYENYGDIKGFESLPSVSGSYEIIELDGDNEGTIEKEPSELGTLAQQNEVDTETEEQYEPIEENEVIPTSEENTSTFSIDVDVASYANIRRFIKDQETPPPGSVRIEEMVNYFNYDYAQPEDTVPFAFHTEVAPSPWDVSKKIVHIGIKGGEIPKTKKLPNNLVFLVDVSGSMSSENKLPLVQKSLSLLVNQLGSDDQISLVVYAGSSGLVLPSTSCSNKSKIINAIRRLESGGSTAGGAGIELAYKVAQQNFKDDGNNRVILCTDGDFNVGVSSQEGLVKLIEKKRETGVFLSVLGFGTGNYQDQKMEQLADHGNGQCAYIDRIEEAQKVLVDEMMGTLHCIAKDVKIQVEFDSLMVKNYRLIGYENRVLENEDFEDDTKDAGEIGAGHTVTAMYEIEVDAQAQPQTPLVELRIRYKQPKNSKSALLTHSVLNSDQKLNEASENLRFSASVAGFGMMLRHSKYLNGYSSQELLAMCRTALGKDKKGYRKEFVKLVEKADNLGILARK